MIGFFISLLSGALMSIQGVWNTQTTQQTSLWVTNILVQFSAGIVCLIAWVLFDRTPFHTLCEVTPKYCLLGGVLGAFITLTVIQGMQALGPAKAVLLIVIAQLLVAYLIELLGLFGTEKVEFSVRKLIGIVVAIVGFVLFKWE